MKESMIKENELVHARIKLDLERIGLGRWVEKEFKTVEIDNIKNTEKNSKLYVEEKIKLFEIDDLDQYINRYKGYYLGMNIAPEIIIKDCLISLNNEITLEKGSFLTFKNCNIEFFNTRTSVVNKIINCDILSPEGKTLNIRASLVENSIFQKTASITSTEELGILNIQNSIFEQPLSVEGIEKSICNINHCNIKTLTPRNYVNITNSIIETLNTDLSLIIDKSIITFLKGNPLLSELTIQNSTVKTSNFNRCKFSTCALFSDVTFETTPTIDNIEFSSCNVDFKDVTFLEKDNEKALGCFRSLTQACSKAGYEHGAILFHAFELETRYNYYLKKEYGMKDFPEKISSKIHKWFTSYGTDLMRPFYFLLGFFFTGLALNIGYHYLKLENIFLKKSFIISLKNTLGPLSFALSKTYRELEIKWWGIEIYSAFQIIICSIIWFLIVFMIRRRFKI